MKYLSVTSLLCFFSLNSLHAAELHTPTSVRASDTLRSLEGGGGSIQEDSQEMSYPSPTSSDLSQVEQAQHLIHELHENNAQKAQLFADLKSLLPRLIQQKKALNLLIQQETSNLKNLTGEEKQKQCTLLENYETDLTQVNYALDSTTNLIFQLESEAPRRTLGKRKLSI